MKFLIKENSWIALLAAKKLKSDSVAIVVGKTIHLHHISRVDFLRDERWVKHEMCHIAQFKRHGFSNFLLKYLWESTRHGYFDNKYEIEARNAENS